MALDLIYHVLLFVIILFCIFKFLSVFFVFDNSCVFSIQIGQIRVSVSPLGLYNIFILILMILLYTFVVLFELL